jgi:type I restriction-modification system DNA methylase subunit
MTSIQQRAALQSQIWKIANDVRGAVGVMAERGVQRLQGSQKP